MPGKHAFFGRRNDMKVVAAIDSMKGSIGSIEAGTAAKAGIRKVCRADVVIKPVADGGEGTTESMIEGLGGEYREVRVTGPDGKHVTAKYGILPDGETIVMEMAEAAGITLIHPDSLDPWNATSFGVGEMIRDAVEKGGRKFIIGIGGSATTDGGAGMLQALGYRFLNAEGRQIAGGIGELDRIVRIDTSLAMPELKECSFRIACDVKNPLCGENGAVYVYGPQKGVRAEERAVLDEKMKHYAGMTKMYLGKDHSEEEGAGAAGGLGFAFISYMPDAVLKPGIDIIMEAVGLEEEIRDADLVITGEGRLDSQTAMGKVPVGVAKLAKKYGKKVIAFAGSVTDDAGVCNEAGIDAFFPIVRGITTLEEAMEPERARKNMELAVEQVFRLICG